jgi:glyoxylase-like metal-dependent hydrolase (beta-lactamase superfamily II)
VAAPTTRGPREGPRPPKQEQEDASTEIVEVSPGILRLQLPIQFTGLGHVNCYALEDRRGFAVVDPGLPGKKSWQALTDRLDRASIPLRRVHTVVVTHSHPDHFGGAGLLAERTGADILTSSLFRTWWDPDEDDTELAAGTVEEPVEERTEGGLAPRPSAGKGGRRGRQSMSPFGRPTPWGGRTERLPLAGRLRMALMRLGARRWFRTPRPTIRVADDDTTMLAGREWFGVLTPGHTADHLCLFDPEGGVLLSGDHVLPTITPHISGMVSDDSLEDYIRSLDRVLQLDTVHTVLPAHGHPFTTLDTRVAEIKQHHDDRLERLREISHEMGEASVRDLSRALFAPSAWGSLAESETYAHLEHLRLAGMAERREEAGILLYTCR